LKGGKDDLAVFSRCCVAVFDGISNQVHCSFPVFQIGIKRDIALCLLVHLAETDCCG